MHTTQLTDSPTSGQGFRALYPELSAWDSDCLEAAWSVYCRTSHPDDTRPTVREEAFMLFLTRSMQAALREM